tara:strand:+ start:88 stop:693 length:606 start_codon:yes stop_codon:yes gene_type:complete
MFRVLREMPGKSQQFTHTDNSDMTCKIIIGIAVVIIITMFMRTLCKNNVLNSSFISGFKSHVNNDFDYHAKMKFDDSNVENTTLCKEGDSTCMDFKNVAESVKEENVKNLKKVVDENTNIVLFIYAPWCPHCHTALPEYKKASKLSNKKFAVANAELLPRELLGQLNVTHFPFICSKLSNKMKVYKGPLKADNFKEFADEE